jgi:two-component system, chemotaxis family, protein-glutamate methylesterase/glutaminase
MKRAIRTVLIDDSSFMRKVVGDIIEADDAVELVGVASNGKEGVLLINDLRPDVVVTDMVMPEYDGLYVVREVMENFPRPVILLSSLDKGSQRIFEALENGAFEFIDKPSNLSGESIRNYPLLNLIKHAALADVSLLSTKRVNEKKQQVVLGSSNKIQHEIIVIGASTGGPSAVESIVTRLPVNLNVPVVVGQHMPARFLETFAHRLSTQSQLPVKLASKGLAVTKGNIYIAPGDVNTRIERSTIDNNPIFTFSQRTYDEFNNPSINCLMESVVDVYGHRVMGLILTGMGKDGTRGLKKIRDAGGFTIAQDEESCVVYGMPKAAFEHGAVKKLVSLREIPAYIIQNL